MPRNTQGQNISAKVLSLFLFISAGGIAVKKLTSKQEKWLEHYKSGKSASESARLAGYNAKDKHTYESIGSANLKKLKEHIDAEQSVVIDKAKAVKELIEFWSEIINDPETDIRQRIKASELKAKAAGVFTDSTPDVDLEKGSVVFLGEGELNE